MSEKKEQSHNKMQRLMSIMAPTLILLVSYLMVSFLDLWALVSYQLQAVIFVVVLATTPVLILAGAKDKLYFASRKAYGRLFLLSSAVFIVAVLNFSQLPRLTKEALMPRALFAYPEATVIATVSPPIYLAKSSVTENMPIESDEAGALSTLHEGSVLNVVVSGLAWKPVLELSDGTGAIFEKNSDGEFVASIEIDNQVSWAVKQGNRVVGRWPIVVIDDEEPKIQQFQLAALDNKKGYIAVDLKIEDDLKIMAAEVELVDGGGNKSDNTPLSVREIKRYDHVFYLDFTGSDLAGQKADLLISIEDEAGQISTKLLSDVDIPVKNYKHPIAHKLISLYKELATPGFDQKALTRQIRALGLLPDAEQLPPVYYMALRSAYWRLVDPSEPEDMETARNLLWDVAQKIENRELGPVENSLLASLDELTLSIRQKHPVSDIRERLRVSDRYFREYRNAARLSTSDHYTVQIDMRALRKLYSYVLAYSDQEKYYNAALIVDHLRKGIVQNDDLILSKDGLANYFSLTESRQIINNLIAIQRTLLASSNNDQMRGKLNVHSEYLSKSEKTEDAKENEFILQTKIGDAFKRLGKRISIDDRHSEYLIRNATDLIDSILVNMKNSETNQVAESQSELLGVMSSLKRSIDKPLANSPELKNILKEISTDPAS